MERLSALDASFLEVEDADPHISMAVGGIAVLTGPAPGFDEFTATIGERIKAEPRLHQVLRSHAWDLSAPHWADDPHFDIARHVHRVALPRPGDDAALHLLAADIMGRRLDRDRPLWESWVIEGLSHNRWAILTKIHHCIADGISASRMLARMFDAPATAPQPVGAPPAEPDRRRPSLNPLRLLNTAWRTSVDVTNVAVQAAHGAAEIAGGLIRPAGSSLNGPVGGMRRFSWAEVSMGDVEKICTRFGVTVNDVALAAITDSFRSMLLNRGETPKRTSLRTLVPVSVRAADAEQPDNRVAAMLPYLPVDLPNPLQQLEAVHRRLTIAKNSGQREASSIFVAAANLIPFAVSAWTVKAFSRLPQRGVVTLATNVPGPRQRLQVMGREVVRMAPIPPLGAQLRTAVAILSYADHLSFGILADYDHAPDVDQLADGITRAVAHLAEMGAAPHRSTALGTLALVVG
ncbi:MAG: wax ester/triacylglycerol synthase family O-acyltransferase [Actinomycetota bacterium]|nr:wax ester/triacylglycerol synthase family O-acyltransferase [Actinomycetota bacterium]